MDLISVPSLFQIAASIPLLMVLLHMLKPFMDHPVVTAVMNTSLVILENTKAVWKPVVAGGLVVLRKIVGLLRVVFPTVKALIVMLVNATAFLVQKAQSLGMSLSTAFTTVLERFEEVGEAIVILARAVAKTGFYFLKSVSLVVTSFESVIGFAQQLVFAPSTITWNDLYNIMLPFAICFCMIALAYYRFRPSKAPVCREVEVAPLRRSSRIARKRAMLLCDDMSDAFLPSKKNATTASNL